MVGKEFQEEELNEYKRIIFDNIFKGMKVLIDARDKLNVSFEHEEAAQRATLVFSHTSSIRLDEPLFLHYAPALQELWKDAGILRIFDRRREFQLVRMAFHLPCLQFCQHFGTNFFTDVSSV